MTTRFSPLTLGICFAAFVLAALAAFLFAYSRGPELSSAERAGVATGTQNGAERGSELGYRAGFRRAYAASKKRAHASAKRKTIKAGAAEASTPTPVSRNCGDLVDSGAGSYSVRSLNVTCGIATQVATQWETNCTSGSCTVPAGFSCSYTSGGIELIYVTCVDGSRKVTFENGA